MAKTAKTRTLVDVAKLTKAQAKVEHMRLALEFEGHDRRYYQDDAPSITDAEYDALRQRYNAIEKRFPEFVTSSKKMTPPDVAKLTKAQAKVEHMRLALEIEGHNERYYQKDAPTV